jgi:hypothetical protein
LYAFYGNPVKAQARLIKNSINSIHPNRRLSYRQVYRNFARVRSVLRIVCLCALNGYTCKICFIIKCHRVGMLCESTHRGYYLAHCAASRAPRSLSVAGRITDGVRLL